MEPRPNRRRRWLIVAFVLAVVSLCSWWCWPRGDARFVGKWEIVSFDGNNGPFVNKEFWTFDSNGHSRRSPTPAPSTEWRQWRVEGQTLFVQFAEEGFLSRLDRLATKIWDSFKGRGTIPPHEIPYTVTKLTDRELYLEDRRNLPRVYRFRFRRVLE